MLQIQISTKLKHTLMDNKNTTKETLRCLSYNSTGCNESKLLHINKVAQNCDFILIQKHWLLDKQQHKLRNGVKGFTGFLISGIDESEYILTGGRANGGYAIL